MSYQVIARKWRPARFEDVVGQVHVTRTLANAVEQNRVAHAYIFSGARGVGKTTTARILAKVLNCAARKGIEPCQTCDSCKEITAGTSLDVIEIDAASNRGIDQIRELREMVKYAPLGGRFKVVLLDEAHMLTGEASNALLKTLEEPPDRVIFIMATTQPEELVDTIRSRSQHFHFRALTFQEITDQLQRIAAAEKLTLDSGALAVIARAAEGSMRDGLSVLEQAIAYCGTTISDAQVREILGVVPEEVLDTLVAAITSRSAEQALALVHKLIFEGQNLQHFCREAIRHFRNLLVARVCGADSDLITVTADERPRLAKSAEQFSEEDLTRYFQLLLRTDDDLRRRPDPRLHLEMGLLRMVNATRLAELEEILGEIGGSAARSTAAGSAGPAKSGAAQGMRACAAAEIGFAASNARATQRVAPTTTDLDVAAVPRSAAISPARTETASTTETAGPAGAAPAAPPSIVKMAAGEVSGLEAAQVEAIKAAIAEQHKFLWSLIEPVTRWEVEGGEMRLYFPPESRTLADMLQARDPLEKLRAITSRVVGQPLRVCVKLDAARGGATPRTSAELRARFEQDPLVREMLRRFGGRISEVQRRSEE